MESPRNIVGPQIRQLREKAGLTQAMLVAKIHLKGWDMSRETLAKLEAQIRWVSDFELVFIADALGVEIQELLPPNAQKIAKSLVS